MQDERAILQAAMDRSMGQATYGQVRHEFEQRVMRGEFRAVEQTLLAHVPRRDQQLDIADAQMGRGPAEHPGRRVLLVLVDGLVEVDLVEVAEQSEPVREMLRSRQRSFRYSRKAASIIRVPASWLGTDGMCRRQRRYHAHGLLRREQEFDQIGEAVDDRVGVVRPGVVAVLANPDRDHPRRPGPAHVLAAAIPDHGGRGSRGAEGAEGGGEDLRRRLAPPDLAREGHAVEETGQTEAGELSVQAARPVRGVGAEAEPEAAPAQLLQGRDRRRRHGDFLPPRLLDQAAGLVEEIVGEPQAQRRVGAPLLRHGIDLPQPAGSLVAGDRLLDPVVHLDEQRRSRGDRARARLPEPAGDLLVGPQQGIARPGEGDQGEAVVEEQGPGAPPAGPRRGRRHQRGWWLLPRSAPPLPPRHPPPPYT